MALRNAFENLAVESKQDEHLSRFGEVSETPAANTLLGRLGDLEAAVVAQNATARKDANNSSNTPLAVGDSFTGQWSLSSNTSTISFFAITDQPFDVARLEWSADGENVNSDLLATADLAINVDFITGIYVYYPDPQTYLLDKYYRIVLEKNTGTNQTLMSAYLWAFSQGAQPFSFLDPDGIPSTLSKALLTKSINPSLTITQFTDETHGALPTGASPVIDPVLNTAANVLDSGWIDTATFAGKNVINAVTNAAVDVYLMNASDDQGSNIFGNTIPTFISSPAGAKQLSALYADNYFRVLIANQSGVTLSDYSIRVSAAPESTDGITTSLDSEVFGFFPAKITRSVGVGKNPDGFFTNTDSPGFYSAQSTSTPRLAGVEFAPTTWSEINGYGSQQFAIFGNQALVEEYYTAINGQKGSVLLEVSIDGVTKTTDFILELGANPPQETAIFTIAFPYFRIKVAPTVVDESFFVVNAIAYGGAPTAPIRAVEAAFDGRGLALLTKSVPFGKQPDGDYVAVPSDGEAGRYVGELAGGADITIGPLDTDGYRVVEVAIVAGTVGQLAVTYYTDTGTLETLFQNPVIYEYTAEDAARGFRIYNLDAYVDGISLNYIQGPAGEDNFKAIVTMRGGISDIPQASLSSTVSKDAEAAIGQNVLIARDGVGDDNYGQIGRKGSGDGLNTHTVGHLVETPVKPLNSYRVAQQTVVASSAIAFPAGRLAGRKTIEFSNHSNSVNVFYGPTINVTALTGKLLRAGTDTALELDAFTDFYWIAQDTGAATLSTPLPAASASGTATSPSNALSSDNVYASLTNGQYVDTTGYTYSQSLTDINTVGISVEMAKSATPATQTAAVQESQTNTFPSNTAVFTTPALLGGEASLYVATVVRNDTNAVVTVTGAGLTFTALRSNLESAGKHLDVWYAYGTATAGAITATLSSSTTGIINVLRVSGADPDDPIQSSGITTGTGTGVTGAVIDKTALGLGVLSVAHEANSSTPAGTNIERFDGSIGSGSNTVSLTVDTRDYTVTGSEGLITALSSSSQWGAVQTNINPAPTNPITVDVYMDDGEGAGFQLAGELTFSSTTDSIQLLDVSGIHALTEDAVNNTTTRVLRTSEGIAPALLDRLGLVVGEGNADTAARLSCVEVADNDYT